MTKKKGALTRRDFIRGTVGATLGTSLVGLKWSEAKGAAAGSSLVTIVRDEKAMDAANKVNTDVLKEMLEQTLIKFTGQKTVKDSWLSLLKPTDKIGLVPTPHLNPTHDEVTDAVKGSLVDSGIPEANITLAQGGPDKPKACTALIALPALKAHWLTGLGTVMKLYILYSGNARQYHEQNNAKLGETWNLPFVKGKTKLILVDALHPLFDKGPQVDPRYKWSYNGLIAGTDPVAVDTVCLKIIMNKREATRGEPWPISPPPLCVEAADKEYGLGTNRMENIKVETYGWKKGLLL
jgi:hypothetical protein